MPMFALTEKAIERLCDALTNLVEDIHGGHVELTCTPKHGYYKGDTVMKYRFQRTVQ